MICAIDIGNSNVVIGLWDGKTWKEIWRLDTRTDLHAPVFYVLKIRECLLESNIQPFSIRGIILSSVVPDLNLRFINVLKDIFEVKPILLSPFTLSNLRISIDDPSEIGTDLIANAVGAASLYQSDCLIVDFGTALTCTSVTKDYEILGVAIAPGLKTAIKALYGSTAQLPDVPVKLPKSVIGKNTQHAIQAGVICGYYGLVKELMLKTRKEAGIDFKAIATGGLSPIIREFHTLFDEVNAQLTLDGLRIIFEKSINDRN